MILRTIAFNTFGMFLRDKVLIVVAILFTCGLLLMLTPLLGAKAMASIAQAQAMVLELVSVILIFTSGFGSLLAAWAAADSVATEMKSGTILAVMARPVKRWEFLLGKFFGVMLLMSAYVAMMLALTYLLALIGGQRIHSAAWLLVLYPLVRYSIYAALAMMLVTWMHPLVAWGGHDGDCSGRDDCGAKRTGSEQRSVAVDQECALRGPAIERAAVRRTVSDNQRGGD